MPEAPLAVRDSQAGKPLDQVLRAPLTTLLGVTGAAAAALTALGVKTVFDLGASSLFATARAAAEAGAPEGLRGRFGLIPADWLDVAATKTTAAETPLGSLPLSALRSLTVPQAAALSSALGVETVADLAAWPPYLGARRLLGLGVGSTEVVPDAGSPADQAAEALRPRMGEYPTERVYYRSLVLFEVLGDSPVKPTALETAGPISLKPSVAPAGFTRPAIGAQLTIAQSWFARGVTLGQLLHSLALAPGEATRVAVVDWTRRSSASTSESVDEAELLAASTNRARAVSEVQAAVAQETLAGFSRTDTAAQSESGSIQASVETGLVASLFASGGVSGGYQSAASTSSAESSSFSQGKRSVVASMNQRVNDRTEQHASSARSRRASAVREVSQSEHQQVSTRIVANYNHMYAMTVQYYEVVQVYRLETRVAQAERVLFVPVQLLDFSDSEVLDRFRGVLLRAALSRRSADLLADDLSAVALRPVAPVRFLDLPLTSAATSASRQLAVAAGLAVARPVTAATTGPGAAVPTDAAAQVAPMAARFAALTRTNGVFRWDVTAEGRVAALIGRSLRRPGSEGLHFPDDTLLLGLRVEGMQIRAVRLDRPGGAADSEFSVPTDRSALDLDTPVALAELAGILLAKAADPADSGTLYLRLRRAGREFEAPAVPVEISAGTDLRLVLRIDTDQEDRRRELVAHLQANRLHYSQAVMRGLDPAMVMLLVADYSLGGVPLARIVEPTPVTVTGNWLVLRAPVDADEDSGLGLDGRALTWQELLADRGVDFEASDPRTVPMPTGGVFAEAVLGRSNAAEKLDITRFWNWQDSPIPLAPPEIAQVSVESRAQPEGLVPGQLGAPVVNMVNAPALPDPAGLGAALNAVANGQMFRDPTGLPGTQAAAQAGQAATIAAATDAAQVTSANMRTQAQKAVAMGQIAADLVKTVMTGGMAGGGSVQGISGEGARINHGQSLDQRGAATQGGAPAGGVGSGGMPSRGATEPPQSRNSAPGAPPVAGNEQAAFRRAVWGQSGESGGELVRSVMGFADGGGGGDVPANVGGDTEFEAFYKQYLDLHYPNVRPTEDSPYTRNRDCYTLRAYTKAFGSKPAWDPTLGFKPNELTIRKLYDYYQAVFRAKPDALLWAGLGRMAGGAVLGGLLNPALPDPSFLSATMVLIGKAIFLDLAWQHELFLEDPKKAIAMAHEHDAEYPAKTKYETAWKKIATGKIKDVEDGNRMLLENEQFSIIQPLYEAIRKSSEWVPTRFVPWPVPAAVAPNTTAELFARTSAFTNNIHPYHKPFLESFPTTRNADITVAADRWEWITQTDGMWDKWVRIPATERKRLTDLPMDDLIAHRWAPVPPALQALLPPGGP